MNVKILEIEQLTHDVKRFVVEKPEGYTFVPGQAADVAVAKPGWEEKSRPFTFTSLSENSHLEFIIKTYPLSDYPNHTGVTEEIHKLISGNELIIGEPWGTINYQKEGIFIAGGAGITPFIAIFRDLKEKGKLEGNKLFFSNKTIEDIILEEELKETFNPEDLILTLTRQEVDGYETGRIDDDFIKKYLMDFSKNFYICGPKKMVEELKITLSSLGAKSDSIIFEQ